MACHAWAGVRPNPKGFSPSLTGSSAAPVSCWLAGHSAAAPPMNRRTPQAITVHPPEVREPLPLSIHHLPLPITFALWEVRPHTNSPRAVAGPVGGAPPLSRPKPLLWAVGPATPVHAGARTLLPSRSCGASSCGAALRAAAPAHLSNPCPAGLLLWAGRRADGCGSLPEGRGCRSGAVHRCARRCAGPAPHRHAVPGTCPGCGM